jgi:hypothetical protein
VYRRRKKRHKEKWEIKLTANCGMNYADSHDAKKRGYPKTGDSYAHMRTQNVDHPMRRKRCDSDYRGE